jgi:AraC family transcriptional regulator
MHVSYRYMPPTVVFYARATGPYTSSCKEAWRRMDAWLHKSGTRKLARQAFGIFHDNPRITPPELVRYDACVPAMPCVEAAWGQGIYRQSLPGGACAVCTHTGSYANTAQLFSALHSEIVPKRGLKVDYDRPFMVVYLNDPLITCERYWRTELCIPVLPIPMAIATNDDSRQAHDVVEIAKRVAS